MLDHSEEVTKGIDASHMDEERAKISKYATGKGNALALKAMLHVREQPHPLHHASSLDRF